MHRKQMELSTVFMTAVFCGSIGFATPSFAGNVKWEKYMQRAANAAAIAWAGPCSKPPQFEETRSDGRLRIAIACVGSEEEEATSFIEFIHYQDGLITPDKFDFAG